MGIADAQMDEYGYVMATIPSNIPESKAAQMKTPLPII
jgi:hypothetical protein